MIQRLFDAWVDRVLVDWIIGLGSWLLIGVSGLSDSFGVADPSALYQTLAATALAFLGFGAVAVTLIATVSPTERLTYVMRRAGRALIRVMFQTLASLGAITLFLLTPWILEDHLSDRVLAGLVAGLTVVMALNAGRFVWLLYCLIMLAVRSTDD